MKEKDYSLQDEKERLKRFLTENNFPVNHNYLRMERGPKPSQYRVQSFVFNQIRSSYFTSYYLVFTYENLILLVRDKKKQYTKKKMLIIEHTELKDFSYKEVYGKYCISFTYLDEKHYFYLGKPNRFIDQIFDRIFKPEPRNYLYDNLISLRQRNFLGLL